MDSVLNSIFENNNYTLTEIHIKDLNTKTYINDKYETFILVYVDEITDILPDRILKLCAEEIFESELLTKAQKSNLSVIVVAKTSNKLSDKEKNIIFKIEESDLYYKKYFLWYSEEELKYFKETVNNIFSSENLNNHLIKRAEFTKFKHNQNDNNGYALLSRIYIKIPFLNLNELDSLEKTLSDYVQTYLGSVNGELFDFIVNNTGDEQLITNSLSFFELSRKEINEIEKEIRELVKKGE